MYQVVQKVEFIVMGVYAGWKNSRFLVVPDWYVGDHCRVLARSAILKLNVYLVYKVHVSKSY
jgi:hypothetical protein